MIYEYCKVRNPDSARGPQQSGFPPLIHFVSRWTQRSLLACRELVSLSLPSLSPLATLRVAQYFSFMHSLPVSVLIKLTLYSSEVEDIVSVSVAQNHPKRTNI